MSTFNELIDFTRSTTGTYLDSVVYGEELVTNGDFSNGTTGWTQSGSAQGTWAVTSGVLQCTGSTGFSNYLSTPFTCVVGKTYAFSVDVIAIGNADTYIGIGVTPSGRTMGNAYVHEDVVGTYSATFTATQTTHYVVIQTKAGTSDSVDNTSVKEIIGGQVSGTPLLRTAAINEPRLEYDASGNPLGLLIEEARSNVLLHSEEMTNAVWVSEFGNYGSIASSSLASPAGTGSFKLIAATNNGRQARLQAVNQSGNKVISIFAKAGEYSVLQISDAIDAANYTNFDLANGVIGSSGGYTVKMEDAGNGWYRCSCYDNFSINMNFVRFSVVQSPSSPRVESFSGNGSDGIYLWGAQIETGAFPTSYIPTSGSTVTRAKDIASLPVEKFAYNQDQGSIVCHFNYFFESGNSKRTYEFSDALSANVIRMLDHNNVNQLQANVKFGGAGVAGILINAPTMLSGVKTFQSYKLNGYSGGADGTLAGTDSNGALPIGINKLSIGSNRVGGATMNGHITSLQYYPKKLTNEELELLTQPSASPTMNLTFDGQATSTLVEGLHD